VSTPHPPNRIDAVTTTRDDVRRFTLTPNDIYPVYE
jgi:hypothetical protein